MCVCDECRSTFESPEDYYDKATGKREEICPHCGSENFKKIEQPNAQGKTAAKTTTEIIKETGGQVNMGLKSYDELRNLDISQYCDQRDDLDYLNWAKCIDLLHKNGAQKVYFEPLKNKDGSSLFYTDMEFKDSKGNTNRCYEVGVHVVIDDMEFDFTGPLMNGTNPVKDNSLSQQRVWNCQTRLFVKAVAIHTGLGFNLWLKEEQETSQFDEDLSKHDLMKCQQRLSELITMKMQGGVTMQQMAVAVGMELPEFQAIFTYYSKLRKVEEVIRGM